jgi:hypothetical protein
VIPSDPGVFPLILAEQASTNSVLASLGQFQSTALYPSQLGLVELGGWGKRVALRIASFFLKVVLSKIVGRDWFE